ncbi:alpha-2-macroglobulin [Chitinophaga sp. CF118]|uniref:alpha-2-macroglobulin family protein n=1 Tax=Chitinophaga sp. CF118 TaxID=1884367 RepID=UPI0015A5CE4A|nr:alpha-2-macroglobulin family protein [Chitinophaga sp. CF118]
MAQFNYDAHWKKVGEFDKKGLPKSALEEVNTIYAQAVKQKEDVHLLKALILRIKYISNTEEDETLKNLQDINTHISQFNGPVKAILLSMKGEKLWNYLQQNRYKFYRRTAVENDTTTDVAAWSITRLNKEIATAYEGSLEQDAALKKIAIATYDAILEKGQNTRELRPTLYDLLAHRALDYFKSGEIMMSRPANQFILRDPAAFAPLPVFAAHHFATEDSTSLQYKALLLLQDLLRFHEKDGKAVLLDLDLERIGYMNQVAVIAGKDSLYVKLLTEMEQTYTGTPDVTQVIYLLAQHYYGLSQADGKPTRAENILKAKALCDKAVKMAPASHGGIDCANLLRDITSKDLKMETELVNIPGLPFRTLVTYKNINKIYLRVARIDEAFRQALRDKSMSYDSEEGYWKLIKERAGLKTWEQPLPGSEDFLQHSTEIKIDALPLGQYMILASATPDFPLKENLLAAQFIHVSEISHISKDNGGDDANLFYVLHRQSGKPMADVKLNVWQTVRDPRTDKDNASIIYSAVSEKDGAVRIKTFKNGTNIRMQWIKGEDDFFPDDYRYIYSYNYGKDQDTSKHRTFLFTDRAIYRPGQTVYFKGIVIKQGEVPGKSRILPAYKTVVYLYDKNGDKADSLVVTTNEYGAYSGTFRLPLGRLNGEFRLEEKVNSGSVSFSVEEYKRPKFYVEFDNIKGNYRLGDSVTINGKALAYAGNNIDGAKVKYKVVRVARFPYPWLMWRTFYNVAPREIAQGETTTSADGTFNVVFPVLPDETVDKSLKPIFTYTVEADITDLNGETHSGNQSISAGYQSLEIVVNINNTLVQKDLSALHIVTQNMNGNFEQANVSVVVKPLQHPGRLLRERYWGMPDQFVIAKDGYIKDFPVDIYKDENKQENWEKGAALIKQQVVTQKDSTVSLDAKLPAGFYELEVSTVDKYGETIVQKKTFELVDPTAKTLPYPAYFWSYGNKKSIEPGETTQLLLGTAAKDVQVLQTVEKLNQKEVISSFVIDGKITDRSYTASEEDRGNIQFQFVFVKDNRVYTLEENVIVPWTNKQLDITIATHRDKLLPGAKEQWQVQIKGYKGTSVAAEMLATMYDASLDAFRRHGWSQPDLYPSLYSSRVWTGAVNFREIVSTNREDYKTPELPEAKPFSYDALNWFYEYGNNLKTKEEASGIRIRGVSSDAARNMAPPSPAAARMDLAKGAPQMMSVMAEPGGSFKKEVADNEVAPDAGKKTEEKVAPRTNFNETAFFFPDLRTDKEGNITFGFTVPEALTKWNFLSLAHTKDASFGNAVSSVVTQKSLMVQPNAPRFMREGDKITFSAKISNLSDSSLTGEAHLELLDATTMQPVDGWFQNIFPVQHFTVQKGQSTAVSFPIDIPFNFGSSLLYRVIARAGAFSDGEENALPVLTNTMLVTETLPLAMRGDGTRSFTMPKLLTSDTSETLQQHSFTVEFSGNPAWYAVQALPYLMEYPYECSEQVFNRFYANTLASYVANSIPGIKDMFEKWKTEDTTALQSNLQKNEELKSVLLQETPWVLDAKDEAEQKRRIALLFDLQKMSGEQQKAITQLKQKQLPSGAFPWFTGMWEDQYITQYILVGIGRLQHVKALKASDDATQSMVDKGMAYVEKRIDEDYQRMKKQKVDLSKQHLGYLEAHYLYLRSLFPGKQVPKQYEESYKYYLSQAKKYWLQQGKYTQAMLALALQRSDDGLTAKAIMRSLKEHAIVNDEMGMYWKDVRAGYWWYEAPIETQSILIEAFEQVTNDTTAVSDMKTWLLKNKQTNNWQTTKATADACYAMLLGSSNWLAATPQVDIHVGSKTISSATEKTEAGTAYFKKRFDAKDVKPDMGKIDVTLQGSHGQPAWGAVYWQYFEQLDKITSAATPLTLQKRLFIQKNTASGPLLTAIQEGNELKVGDKVKVQVTMKVDRDMEYVHLKDMRAACFEPENVISASKWQNGVSYYESTKDASTNFFFSRLPKGTYVFEYTLFVTHQGNFSNGISTAQCMYAPEFSAHSEGVRVKVVE